ncbi:hypothetical protein HK105_207865 [Polyrhizophydium stewartii]|uniref:G-protein coupled receptors family 3 profile domain-containing protein n=1 Tax=Polyrhizophydium stewartii TaxID=2732419 RepID=A0ABR4MZI5_9FUNG
MAVAQTRPNNKSDTTLDVFMMGFVGPVYTDLFFMGAYMAAREINANASLLPDATIRVSRGITHFQYDLATVYDQVVDICDNGGHHAYFYFTLEEIIMAASLVCPQMPSYAAGSATPELDNKQLESIYYDIYAMIAQFKYFGWTKTGILFTPGSLWGQVTAIASKLFSHNGISVLTTAPIPNYDSSLSIMYYPQIKPVFEFLKSTRLQIFIAFVDTIADVMLAANRTGIAGRDYMWLTISPEYHNYDLKDRWDTPWDPAVLRGVCKPSFDTSPLYDDPYFVQWVARFSQFRNFTVTNESSLYPSLNPSRNDIYMPDDSRSFGYDDPGSNISPSITIRSSYDAMVRFARAVEKVLLVPDWRLAHPWSARLKLTRFPKKIVSDRGSTAKAYANGSISSAMTLARLTTPFEGTTPLMRAVQYTSQGSALPKLFTMQQFEGTSLFGGWGIVTADIEIDPITGEGKFMPDKAKFMWAGNRSFDDVPRDYPPIVEDYVSLGNRGTLAMLATSSALLLACLTAATWIARHAKSPQITPHSPALLIVMMVWRDGIGLAVMQLDGFTMVGRDNALACRLRPWPVVLGLTLVLTSILQRGILLLGIFQVVLYPRVTWLGNMRSAKGTVIAYTAGTLTIVLLVVLTAAAPMTSTQVYIEAFDGYRFVCDSTPTTSAIMSLITALIVIQLVAAAALAFLGRDMPDLFNTTQHVFASVVVIAVLGGICLLQGNSVKSMQTQFYFESACAGIGAVLVFVVMIASRIGTILSKLSFGDKTNLSQSTASRRLSRSVTSGDSESSDEGPRRLSASRRPNTLSRQKPKPAMQEKVQPQRTHKREYDIEVQPKTHEVVAAIKAFKSPLVMAVPMRTEGMLQQWRTAMIVLIGAPVFCLRIADKRRTSIEYLPLHRLKRIVNHTSDALVGSHQCEVVFSKRRLVLSFGDTARVRRGVVATEQQRVADERIGVQAQAWADMVARTTLALCSREANAVSDGCVVINMALKQASKRESITGKHAPHAGADSS